MVKIDREAVRQILPDQLNIKKVCENGPQKSYSGAERQAKKNFLWYPEMHKCANEFAGKIHHICWKKLTTAVKIDFSVWSRNKETIHALEDCHIAENKKNMNEQSKLKAMLMFSFM